MEDLNLKWIQSGKIGCTFATILAKYPEKVGWVRIFNPDKLEIPSNCFLLSIVFTDKNKEQIRQWCLNNGFYEEIIDNDLIGLRYKTKHGVSWVQYFGKDSHVKTRQTPYGEICFTVKLPVKSYFKVGIDTILHLAHTSVEYIDEGIRDLLWESSFKNTFKRLGYKPTIKEAAKTTWKKDI